MERELFSVKEAAAYLGVSPGSVYRLCYAGALKSLVLDGTRSRRIRKVDLDAYIARSMEVGNG